MLHSFSPYSSLLLVYEGKDAESDRLEANHYDADISNCSTDLNASHDSHHQCSSNDENDGGIGHEDETNHCLNEDDDPRGRDSGHCEDNDSVSKIDSKFLKMPKLRAVSPHSMDSWLNYSNSSDESTTQDMIVRKGIKLNIHEDEATQDTDDVDVYDKINFVNAKSISSFKKSKIDGASCADTATAHTSNPFQFSASTKVEASDVNLSKLTHDTDDGIEVELEEEEEDLSSLSSNIDTIIVSDNGETKFYNSSGEQEEHPSIKKKKSTSGDEEKLPLPNVTAYPKSSPLVDVRIIDFAHTTFTSNDPSELSPNHSSKTVHHGPDGGFLMGIESLRRILSEIIVESI